jgi:DNA-binding MarR family transcriptional regulator
VTIDRKRAEKLQSVLTLFGLAQLALASDADVELAKLKLARTHHRILYLALHNPGVTVGRIVTLLRLTPQAVQGPMRRLINSGYLEQKASPSDGRKRHLYATQAGQDLVLAVAAKQYARTTKALERSTPAEVENFLLMLSRLADADDLAWGYNIGIPQPRAAIPNGLKALNTHWTNPARRTRTPI